SSRPAFSRLAAHQTHDLVGRELVGWFDPAQTTDHAVPARQTFASPTDLAQSGLTVHDVESDLGVREQSELLPDFLWNGDLTPGRDPHAHSYQNRKDFPPAGGGY